MRQKLGRLGIAALIHGITMLLLFHPTHAGRTRPALHRPQELLYLSPATLPDDLQRIDKEVLNGASAVPAQSPGSLSARLARGIEGAFVGARSEMSDHYTSPDGTMYSRITRGNRSTCYTSGTPSYATATRSGGNWVRVNCPPPDSGWVR